MNTKFLNDGRKVAVLGKLNNDESIVQEIFITDKGDEIPSGENFTARSLHDTPVKSYKQKQLEIEEVRLERVRSEISLINNQQGKAYEELRIAKDKVRSVLKLGNYLEENEINTFIAFITGTIEYVVVSDYGFNIDKMIVKFKDMEAYYDGYGERKRYEGLKLLSVAGKSDGNIDYRIHQYSDHSGNSSTVIPCTDYENAVSVAGEIILKQAESERSISIEAFRAAREKDVIFKKSVIKNIKKVNIDMLKNAKRNIEDRMLDDNKKLESILEDIISINKE